jgi:LacI family transcriptional regulator
MEKRVTLRDIAKVAGVHFTTVGLALRNDSRIKPVTVAKVQAVSRTLGYTRDAMLSALTTYRHGGTNHFAGVIACITTYEAAALKTNPTECRMIEAATACAHSQGFTLESFQINAPGMTGKLMSRMLRARGIQGVLLSPRLPVPSPMPDMEWENFSTVAIGYSITRPRVNRVCTHHAFNNRLMMAELRARGYRRIGLILQYEVFERSLGIVPGAFLAEQYLLPEEDRVRPLIAHKVTKASLREWLRKQRIDCVILTGEAVQIRTWIDELGYEVPAKLGVCLATLYGPCAGIAGIDIQLELIGETAVRTVVSMLQQNERGLPLYPRYVAVEGRWVDRPSVRPLPSAQAGAQSNALDHQLV